MEGISLGIHGKNDYGEFAFSQYQCMVHTPLQFTILGKAYAQESASLLMSPEYNDLSVALRFSLRLSMKELVAVILIHLAVNAIPSLLTSLPPQV